MYLCVACCSSCVAMKQVQYIKCIYQYSNKYIRWQPSEPGTSLINRFVWFERMLYLLCADLKLLNTHTSLLFRGRVRLSRTLWDLMAEFRISIGTRTLWLFVTTLFTEIDHTGICLPHALAQIGEYIEHIKSPLSRCTWNVNSNSCAGLMRALLSAAVAVSIARNVCACVCRWKMSQTLAL